MQVQYPPGKILRRPKKGQSTPSVFEKVSVLSPESLPVKAFPFGGFSL
jgi:hypothetical protein